MEEDKIIMALADNKVDTVANSRMIMDLDASNSRAMVVQEITSKAYRLRKLVLSNEV